MKLIKSIVKAIRKEFEELTAEDVAELNALTEIV